MASIFKRFKDWVTAGTEYRPDVKSLIAYLPVGDLPVLLYWQKRYIPYKRDLDDKGNYDRTKEYNGADLTIKLRAGDCESIAAVFSEVIRAWAGWLSGHIMFTFYDQNEGGKLKGHDVAYFVTPDGRPGWIDGAVMYGGPYEMLSYYRAIGWPIQDWWYVNDLGEKLKEVPRMVERN